MARRTRKKRSTPRKPKEVTVDPEQEVKSISRLDWTVRQQALNVLRNHQEDNIDLPILYAALKTVQEIGIHVQVEEGTENVKDGSNGKPTTSTLTTTEPPSQSSTSPQSAKEIIPEEQCLMDAALAVPYLMYKKAKETLLLPRTMGGLAYSDLKAKEMAHDVFAKLGPRCCFVSEDELKKHLPAQDAHKLLPFLQQVGRDARCQVEELQAHWKETAEAQLTGTTSAATSSTIESLQLANRTPTSQMETGDTENLSGHEKDDAGKPIHQESTTPGAKESLDPNTLRSDVPGEQKPEPSQEVIGDMRL